MNPEWPYWIDNGDNYTNQQENDGQTILTHPQNTVRLDRDHQMGNGYDDPTYFDPNPQYEMGNSMPLSLSSNTSLPSSSSSGDVSLVDMNPIADDTLPDKLSSNSRGKRTKDIISLDTLRPLFRIPIIKAAESLGLSATRLKSLCRKLNIPKWPYRRIQALTSRLEPLELMVQNGTVKESERIKINEQVNILRDSINSIILDPNCKAGDSEVHDSRTDGGEDDDDDEVNGLNAPDLPVVEGSDDRATSIDAALSSPASTQQLTPRSPTTGAKRRRSSTSGVCTNGVDIPASQKSVAVSVSKRKLSSVGSSKSVVVQTLAKELALGTTSVACQTLPGKFQAISCFAPPIVLAPLEMRPRREPLAKQYIMLESDISNNFSFHLLPSSMLRYSRDYSPLSFPELQVGVTSIDDSGAGAPIVNWQFNSHPFMLNGFIMPSIPTPYEMPSAGPNSSDMHSMVTQNFDVGTHSATSPLESNLQLSQNQMGDMEDVGVCHRDVGVQNHETIPDHRVVSSVNSIGHLENDQDVDYKDQDNEHGDAFDF